MRVLVVDDDPAVRDSLARTLRFEGHEVQTAEDGQGRVDGCPRAGARRGDPGRRQSCCPFRAPAGVAGAAFLGRAVARAGLRPVQRLTGAVEDVTTSLDLTRPLPVDGVDEIARLGSSVNTGEAALRSELSDGRAGHADHRAGRAGP